MVLFPVGARNRGSSQRCRQGRVRARFPSLPHPVCGR